VHIVAICGSLRRDSLNHFTLQVAAHELPDGATIEVADLCGFPAYDEDERAEGIPAAAENLARAIRAAGAVLIVTPEYNYSIPGVLKNALDWVSKTTPQPFRGKLVGLMGASPELAGTTLAQHHLRQILVCLNARVLPEPEVMIGAADTKFDAHGRLHDAKAVNAIRALMHALVEDAERAQ
jgi:chromate reductase, NAD(P)H dehydrogenase (quinone)